MPRQRDNFLLWYRNYLEQLFVVVQPPEGMKVQSNKPQSRELSQPHSQDSQNDGDLAEADQKNGNSPVSGELECENDENPGEEADALVVDETPDQEKEPTQD